MQKTDFDVEIVIGEDCSTDGTRQIVEDLAVAYPKRIHLLAHNTNLGMHENLRATIDACRGEYIAFLEGDDFWTDCSKLQRQADILDDDPNCRLVFHRVEVKTEGQRPNDLADLYRMDIPSVVTVEPLLQKALIPTCSVLVRRPLVSQVPKWVDTLPAGDWAFWILAIEDGYARFLERTMGSYRQHPGGVWSRLTPDEQMQAIVEMLVALEKHGSERVANGAQQRRRQILSNLLRADAKSTYSYRLGHLLLTPARVARNLIRGGKLS